MRISFCSCHQAQYAVPDLGAPSTPAPASGGAYPAQLREDIAIGSRICAAENVFDAFGHLSVRHPSAPDRFLMTKSLAPALARAEDVVELDLDGRACGDENRPLFLERFIHGEIYKMRPDVNAIVHSHSPSVIPFSVVDNPMRAMFHTAAFIAAGVPVFDIAERFGDTDMLVSNHVKGKALAECLGDAPVCLMRAHGSVAVGPSLQHAVFRAVYTEVNAKLQLQATMMGMPIAALNANEGRLADAVNLAGVGRPWDIWKKNALKAMRAEED
jgi:HCOMODA/2-hydroxy-3-carboxy-muconic semialdehyde decarboxylase